MRWGSATCSFIAALIVARVAAADDPPQRPGASKLDPNPLEEVHVGGQRAPQVPTTEGLANSEVRQVPGAFGDPFRAIEVLPGVIPAASGVPFYFIRGAPPGNTGYFLDGIPVPALFHIAVGPSVIHPSLIDKVDLYPGPVPVQYGRYSAGVIAGTLRAPAVEPHGEAQLRLFDAGGLVESPLLDGRATALASARYGYPGLVLPIFSPDTGLAYWDYQTRATYAFDDRNVASVFAFGTYDSLSQRQPDGHFAEQIGFTFHRVDLRIDHRTSGDGSLRAAITAGTDRSGQEGLAVTRQIAGTRLVFDQPIGPEVRMRMGWDALYMPYQTDTTATAVAAQFPTRTSLFAGAWIEAIARPWPWLELVPGVRGDVYSTFVPAVGTTSQAAADPRMVARTSPSKRVTLVTAAGVAHQPPSSLITLPGLDLAPLSAGLQEAWQMSQGVEAKLPARFFGSLTVFYTQLRGLSDASFSCATSPDEIKIASCAGSYLTGRAYGLELLVRRAFSERVAGLFSYTLSRSLRDNPYWYGQGPEVPSRFDRTHVVNLLLTVQLGRNWSAGGRLFAYSGSPYSRLYSPPDAGQSPEAIPPYNIERFDGFTRVDLRLEKRWLWPGGTRLSVFAEMLNALLAKESLGIQCSWTGKQTATPDGQLVNACQQTQVGPIAIPSVGVEAVF